MPITIKEENLDYKKVFKTFVLEINGKEITVSKWWIEDDLSNDYETDYEIDEKDREKLTDEEEEELIDFINDLE